MKYTLILLLLVFAFTVRVPISIWNTMPDQEDFIKFVGTMYNDNQKNNCKQVKVKVLEDNKNQEILFEFECLEKKLIDL
jgi:hypothetical protein